MSSGASQITTHSEGIDCASHFLNSASHLPQARSSLLLSPKLSLGSFTSRTSNCTEGMHRGRESPASGKSGYSIIGRGTAGTVFEIPGSELAVKKGPNVDALWNDFRLTNKVNKAFADNREMLQDLFPEMVIPKIAECLRFFMPDSKDYWDANLERFPNTHRSPGDAFEVDRIMPIPKVERERLIDQYFEQDTEIQEQAKNDQTNDSCLIRVYLGENESEKQAEEPYDSLENFPMRLNMLEEHLLEDTSTLATEMAIALAVLHWQAQVDGQDCEFVLGSSIAGMADRRAPLQFGSDSKPQEVIETRLFNKREFSLWVLDFDKALETELSTQDVDTRLVNAFFCNDPYYPRPDVNPLLWGQFVNSYLRASQAILRRRQVGGDTLSLPQRFINKVVAKREADTWDPERNIVFG